MFPEIVRRMLPLRWQRVGKADPVSIVILLRAYHSFTKDELQLAAERAWRVAFDGAGSPLHCVAQAGGVILMKAGPHLLSFLHFKRPYLENPKENIAWLPRGEQQAAWSEHIDSLAVDYMNPNTDVELAYCVLAKIVAELIDENCSGIYIPRERRLAPNDAELYITLHTMGSGRDAGISVAK